MFRSHRSRRILTAITTAVLASCNSKPHRDPLDTTPFDRLVADSSPTAVLALEELNASTLDAVSAVWWTCMQQDATKDLAVRTRAAVLNAELGFAHGEQFCVAVLRAGLDSARESDLAMRLPESDRWAFPREIALLWLRERFRAAGRDAPDYDPNAGAPQLEAAARAIEEGLRTLPPLRPRLDRAAFLARCPATPAPTTTAAAWREALEVCLASCDQ
ncbi:MAG TPA: hypothetical protein PKE00_04615 [Planctomycetota bacterium]|nr:hypothetical protein [Planctomycetota bacterium]